MLHAPLNERGIASDAVSTSLYTSMELDIDPSDTKPANSGVDNHKSIQDLAFPLVFIHENWLNIHIPIPPDVNKWMNITEIK